MMPLANLPCEGLGGSPEIHALHLDPRSILLLSSFAFLWEASLGVPPSVVLLRHFFSVRLTAPDKRYGCASFHVMDAMVGECIDMEISLFAEGFRREWVFLNQGRYIPLLITPSILAEPSFRWEHALLDDQRLSPVRGRLGTLREVGVIVTLVVREFLRRRITPLQHHSHPMWTFFGMNDPMRLHPGRALIETLGAVLRVLLGNTVVGLPRGSTPCTSTIMGASPASPSESLAGEGVLKGPEPIIALGAPSDTAGVSKESTAPEGASSPLHTTPNPSGVGEHQPAPIPKQSEPKPLGLAWERKCWDKAGLGHGARGLLDLGSPCPREEHLEHGEAAWAELRDIDLQGRRIEAEEACKLALHEEDLPSLEQQLALASSKLGLEHDRLEALDETLLAPRPPTTNK
ncbi:hypothetical protein D1007_53216 [Hordeum vulgare]|nr:hypothetical protein D1007_53216 [Hordeum vulgare]